MKRLLSLMIVAMLLLAACENVATPMEETAVEEPFEEEPVEEPIEEPTEAPTEAPTPTEIAAEPTPEIAAEETPEETATFEPRIGLQQVVGGGLAAPVALAEPDDGTGRLFIVDQVGLIYVVDGDGNLMDEPFLDLRDRILQLSPDYDERGLLGLALHPDYPDNERFFVYYSAPLQENAPEGWDHTSHLSEFTVSADDENVADPASERILLRVNQPQSNHNAGSIAFGADDYLYVPLGDGGGADDTGMGHVEDWYEVNDGGNGQDVDDNLLGSILRLDVDGEEPYGIPEDNPNIGGEAVADEIWAYGFRNPWRMTFDLAGDNELFVGDAGQELWEEVSIVEAGGNYGWNVKEGTHCFNAANPDEPLDECPSENPEGDPLIDPVIEFANAKQTDGLGLVVVGGYVYRGDALPAWDGSYIFGQWSTSFGQPQGSLLVATRPEGDGEGLWELEPIEIVNREDGELNEFLLSFGQDTEGEVYVLTSDSSGPSGDTGKVFRIVPPDQAEMMEEEATAEPTPTPEAEVAAEEVEVAMRNTAYEPEEITVEVGTTVIWVNEDGFAHTVTSGTRDDSTGMFDETVDAGDSFSFTFEEAGPYPYFCSLHPGMDGVVTVE